MTVPTLITDLSVTPATNAALISGSDSPIVLDDHLRTVYAFIASVYANSGNGWASPYLTAANPVYTGTLTGGTGVVNLGSGQFIKDSGGNVGIGKTPSSPLDITSTLPRVIDINSTSASGVGIRFNNAGVVNGYVGSAKYAVVGGALADFSIDASGPNSLVFATNDTERMRIDSSGNVLVGTSSSAGNAGVQLLPNAGACIATIDHVSGTASAAPFVYLNYNGASIGSITQSGTTAVLYNTTSDRRLKRNIADAPSAGALIDSILIRSFDWISDNSHQRYGMVAQELFEVAPEAVHAPADPEAMMAVDYSKLVPMLVKEVQSLRARVSELEAA